MTPGRPLGNKNEPGHSAGGLRANSGRKPVQKAQSTNAPSGGPSVPSIRSSTLNTGKIRLKSL